MEAFLVSLSTVSIAEMGDRTQLLALVLAAKYRKPWPILLGILIATIANHAIAGYIGVSFGKFLTPIVINALVGASMLGMALWSLKPDTLGDKPKMKHRGAFVATLIAFFIAEMGDKTQIATIALAAGYAHLAPVIAGTVLGMMAANTPVVFLGHAFADKLPLARIHLATAILFAIIGAVFLLRASGHLG